MVKAGVAGGGQPHMANYSEVGIEGTFLNNPVTMSANKERKRKAFPLLAIAHISLYGLPYGINTFCSPSSFLFER